MINIGTETFRYITHCYRINEPVNHEIAVIKNHQNRETIAGCTGIEEGCEDCFIVKLNEARGDTGINFCDTQRRGFQKDVLQDLYHYEGLNTR